MAGFLGAPRHVPTCLLNAGQPARSAPHVCTHVRAHRQAAQRSARQSKAIDTWILHAVRSDKQNTQVDSSVLQLISDLTNKVEREHAAILAENEPNLEGMTEEDAEGLKQKVQQSIQKLQKGLLERETEVQTRMPRQCARVASSVHTQAAEDTLPPTSLSRHMLHEAHHFVHATPHDESSHHPCLICSHLHFICRDKSIIECTQHV